MNLNCSIFDTEPAPVLTPATEDVEEELSAHQHQSFTALRDENKLLVSEAALYHHRHQRVKQRQQGIPKPRDLVIVENYAVDSSKGRKAPATCETWLERLRKGTVWHGINEKISHERSLLYDERDGKQGMEGYWAFG